MAPETVQVEERGASLYFEGLEYVRKQPRTLWVTCDDLSVRTHVDGKTGLPLVTIRGRANIEGDSLCIIGNAGNSGSRLALTIFSCEWPAAEEVSPPPAEGTDLQRFFRANDFGLAELGYTTADWEIGNTTEWWLQLTIPRQSLSVLSAAVEAGRARLVRAGIHFDSLYVHDQWAPPSVNITWYLRPGSDGDPDNPDIAFGMLSSFSWANQTVPEQEPAPRHEAPADSESIQPRQNYEKERLAA